MYISSTEKKSTKTNLGDRVVILGRMSNTPIKLRMKSKFKIILYLYSRSTAYKHIHKKISIIQKDFEKIALTLWPFKDLVRPRVIFQCLAKF